MAATVLNGMPCPLLALCHNIPCLPGGLQERHRPTGQQPTWRACSLGIFLRGGLEASGAAQIPARVPVSLRPGHLHTPAAPLSRLGHLEDDLVRPHPRCNQKSLPKSLPGKKGQCGLVFLCRRKKNSPLIPSRIASSHSDFTQEELEVLRTRLSAAPSLSPEG